LEKKDYSSILKVLTQRYSSGEFIHTSGPKSGEPFSVHLVNVGFASATMADLYHKEVRQLDQQTLDSFILAAFFHDTNKIDPDKRSLRGSVGELGEFLRSLELGVDFDERKVIGFAASHGKDGPVGSKLDMDRNQINLARVLMIADNLELFSTANLSTNPQKMQELNDYVQMVFPNRELSFVSFREFRNVLTTELIEASYNSLKDNRDIPVALYRDGIVYLKLKDQPIEFASLKKELVQRLLKRILDARTAVIFRQGMIQIKPAAFGGIPLSLIVQMIGSLSSNDKSRFCQGLYTLLKRMRERDRTAPNLDDDHYLRALGLSLGTEIPTGGKPSDFESIASNTQRNTGEIIEEFTRAFSEVHYNLSDQRTKIFLENYIESTLETPEQRAVNIDGLIKTLNGYGNPKATCSICGSEYDVAEMQAAEVRRGTSVQQFSNNLPANMRRDPKRYICMACRATQILQKTSQESARSDFYIIGVPYTFFPAQLEDFMKDDLNERIKIIQKTDKKRKDAYLEDFLNAVLGETDRILNYDDPDLCFTNFFSIPLSIYNKKLNPGHKATEALGHISKLHNSLPVKYFIFSNLSFTGEDLESTTFEAGYPAIQFQSIPSSASGAMKNLDLLYEMRKLVEHHCELDHVPTLFFKLSTARREEIWVEASRSLRYLRKTGKGDTSTAGRFLLSLKDELERKGVSMREKVNITLSIAKIGFETLKKTGRPYWNLSDYALSKAFEEAFEAVRKFDPKLHERDDLESLVLNNVLRAIEYRPAATEFKDRFMEIVDIYGDGDLKLSRERLIESHNTLRSIYLGGVKMEMARGRKGGND